MRSPWTNTDNAFEPMFNDVIEIVCSNGNRQTLSCVLLTDGTGEVLTNEMIGTDRQDISLNIKKEDWWFLKNVEIGDIINREVNGTKMTYSVSEIVDDFLMGKVIKARSFSDED